MLEGAQRVLAHSFAAHVHVGADPALGRERLGEELDVDVREELLVAAQRVLVQRTDDTDVLRVLVVERRVMDVAAGDLVAERHVLLRVQDVRVPERVDDVGNGVLVEWIEYGDGVVLLQGKDAPLQPVVADHLASLQHVRLHLCTDRFEVLRLDALEALDVEIGHGRQMNRIEKPRCTHDSSPG